MPSCRPELASLDESAAVSDVSSTDRKSGAAPRTPTASRPPTSRVDDAAEQVLAWFDRDVYVLPEERVVNAEVVESGTELDLGGFAKDQRDAKLAVDAHEDLPLTAVRRIVADEPDRRAEVVGLGAHVSRLRRPAIGAVDYRDRHPSQGNADPGDIYVFGTVLGRNGRFRAAAPGTAMRQPSEHRA
jgi:hypothetical protein